MIETPLATGTVTLDLTAKMKGGQEFTVGELEIPITIDADEVKAGVTEALEEYRTAQRAVLAAGLEPGHVYFVCGGCERFLPATTIRIRGYVPGGGALCEDCAQKPIEQVRPL